MVLTHAADQVGVYNSQLYSSSPIHPINHQHHAVQPAVLHSEFRKIQYT
jgi:hypothetical protein